MSQYDVDFRSGANIQELNNIIDQFDELDRHEFDDQMALEVHSMKEHIFHITGCLSKMDSRFPVANEYMLLSGGLKTGSVHIDHSLKKSVNLMENSGNPGILNSSNSDNASLNNSFENTHSMQSSSKVSASQDPNSQTQEIAASRGDDFDLDYTLLVPVIKISENEHENSLILDMRKSEQCHSWLVARPEIDQKLQLWEDCFVTGPPRQRIVNDLVDTSSPSQNTNNNNNASGSELINDINRMNILPINDDEVGPADPHQQTPEQNAQNGEDPSTTEQNNPPGEDSDSEDLSNELIYLCPILVANWFSKCILQICQNTEYMQQIAQEQKGKGIKGIPNIISCKINPPGITLILACGGTRIQYDLIPVISFYGWPKVAGNWLNLPHIWQNLDNVGEVTKGFHLIPPSPLSENILVDLGWLIFGWLKLVL